MTIIEDMTDLEKINHAHQGLGEAVRAIELLPEGTLGYAESGDYFSYTWPIRDEMLADILNARMHLRKIEGELMRVADELE